MLCERCNQQPATVHLQQIINGQVTETYLCQSCAQQTDVNISFDNLFQGFLSSLFMLPEATKSESLASEIQASRCPSCGLTYHEFRKTGKFGCSQCYQSFKKEVDAILKNIQSSNLHQGKFPKRVGVQYKHKRELEGLKNDLRKAIEEEEYENAASIRDQIKRLESEAL